MDRFPLDFFPDKLIPIIQEVAYCNRFDSDYLCASILSVCSSAIGNSYALRVKDQWIERPSLWTAIVGKPGIAKSHPVSWAMEPISSREKQAYKEYRHALKDWQSDPDKDNKPKPELIKTVIGDATPEAIANQLSINERGILIHNDELAGFLGTFQRYNKGNDEQFYLTVWSGKPWIVDRKTSFPIRINEPVVNINGTIQPSVLEKLLQDKEDSGFIDRWLFVHPKDVKKEYWTDDVVSRDSIETYHKLVDDLMNHSMTMDDWGNMTSHIIEYEWEAMDAIKKWHINNTDKINESSLDAIRSIRAKMEIYIHRFALIAYLIDNAVDGGGTFPYKVDLKAAERACRLADYFLHQAIDMRMSEPSEALDGVWKEVYNMLPGDEQEFQVVHYMQLCGMMNIGEGTAKSFLSRNVGKLFQKAGRGRYYKI